MDKDAQLELATEAHRNLSAVLEFGRTRNGRIDYPAQAGLALEGVLYAIRQLQEAMEAERMAEAQAAVRRAREPKPHEPGLRVRCERCHAWTDAEDMGVSGGDSACAECRADEFDFHREEDARERAAGRND